MKKLIFVLMILAISFFLSGISGKYQFYTSIRSDKLYFDNGIIYFIYDQGYVKAGEYSIIENFETKNEFLIFRIQKDAFYCEYKSDNRMYEGVGTITVCHNIYNEIRHVQIPIKFSIWKIDENE
jgi:hypothetical protein